MSDARPTLHDLAVRFNSDKLHSHSYIPMYELLFQGRTVRRLLEVGIGFRDLMQPFVSPDAEYVHGSSLRMWEEYFPEAQIFGCDVREETLIKTERIRTMWCDQSSGESLANMVFAFLPEPFAYGGGFDVIIDDGSHQTAHQMLTFDCLYPRLNEGGVYVVEDVQEPERLAAHTGGTIFKFNKRPDDVLVVVRKDRMDV